MIVAKLFELRDKATFIPVLAVRMQSVDMPNCQTLKAERYLMRRCGYPVDDPQVILLRAEGAGHCSSDPYAWNDRTYQTAHNYILENWHDLVDGQVIDVEFILKETDKPKLSEAITNGF